MAAKWLAKAAVQKGISFMPAPQRINFLFQKHVAKSTVLTDEFAQMRFEWAGTHARALEQHGARDQDYLAVELGAGWFPIVPLCLYLHGAERVVMVDIDDLGRPELTAQVLDAVIAAAQSGELATHLPRLHEDRIDDLVKARDDLDRLGHRAVLERLGIEAEIGDARVLQLDQPADLMYSNTVLEHIDPDTLVGILEAFRRNSHPGTVMSHLIDLCDHYAYFDDVSVYQYLRFSERVWRVLDNSVQPMNRLRVQQYSELYERARVDITEERRGGGGAIDLHDVPLAAPFDSMDPDDVACTSVWLTTVF